MMESISLYSLTGLLGKFLGGLLIMFLISRGLSKTLFRYTPGFEQIQARFRSILARAAPTPVRRSHLPIILASGLMDQRVAVPWWDGFSLRLSAVQFPPA